MKSNKKQTNPKKDPKALTLEDLQKHWYKMLKQEGFDDIEKPFTKDFKKRNVQQGLTQRKAESLTELKEVYINRETTSNLALNTREHFQAWSTYATHLEGSLSKKEYRILWLRSEGLSPRSISKILKQENYAKPISEWAVFYYLQNKWIEVKEWNQKHPDGVYSEGIQTEFDFYMEQNKENLFARPEVLKAKRKGRK